MAYCLAITLRIAITTAYIVAAAATTSVIAIAAALTLADIIIYTTGLSDAT